MIVWIICINLRYITPTYSSYSCWYGRRKAEAICEIVSAYPRHFWTLYPYLPASYPQVPITYFLGAKRVPPTTLPYPPVIGGATARELFEYSRGTPRHFWTFMPCLIASFFKKRELFIFLGAYLRRPVHPAIPLLLPLTKDGAVSR